MTFSVLDISKWGLSAYMQSPSCFSTEFVPRVLMVIVLGNVQLAKQTTIQATGEASTLLEKIQGEGFKLQNLSISFDDPGADADVDIAYEYESSS